MPVADFNVLDQKIDAWVDSHRSEIVEKTQGILRIGSVQGPPAPDAPFGVETREALDFALALAADYGLTVKNLDGYAVHAEWQAPGVASDAPIVGVLAHVDVVPVGTGWSTPPFAAEIVDGAIVARGVIDDKGPAMAGLYALLAVKECAAPLSHRIRMILGANEESGFKCVAHYFAHEEMPATGFTPDAMFPLVYAEKGISNAVLTRPAPPEGERIHVYSLSGGARPNMVPDSAEAILKSADSAMPGMRMRLDSVVGIATEEIEGGKLRVTAKGISAHGSTPDDGLNAIVVLCDALLLLDHQEDQIEMVEIIRSTGADTTGGALGIAGEDDIAGPLTSNLGIAELRDGHLRLTFNIRYPVTWDKDELRKRLQPALAHTGLAIESLSDQRPLYVPLDDPLTKTLLAVYRAETGDMREPQTMGGGTYARVMAKGLAFGPVFPGRNLPGPHEANEAWQVDDLIRATKIYAKTLVRLGNG